MNSIYKIFMATFLVSLCHSMETIQWQFCKSHANCVPWEEVKDHHLNNLNRAKEKKITLRASIQCSSSTSDQAIYLGTVHDTYSIKLNNILLQDWSKLYRTQDSPLVNIPSSLCHETNNLLELTIFDLNGAVIGLSQPSYFGNGTQLYWVSLRDWFFKTGITIGSSYVLIFLSLLLTPILFFRFHTHLALLIVHNFIAAIYLFSFSEIPRAISNTSLLSGAGHFLFLMLQGMSSIFLFHHFFDKKKNHSLLFIFLTSCYLYFIIYFSHAIFSNTFDYAKQLEIILWAAPIILSPAIYALSLISNGQVRNEQKILVPIVWILFVCQLNDLLVFWKVYPGFFSLKFYLPSLSLFFAGIHFSRQHEKNKKKEILAQKAKNMLYTVHDLRTPLDLLQSITKCGPHALEKFHPVISTAIDRLKELSSDLLATPTEEKDFDLKILLKEIIQEMLHAYEISNNRIELHLNQSIMIRTQPVTLKRSLANLLKNAIDASQSIQGKIDIKITESKKIVLVQIFNQGKSINSEVLESLETFPIPHARGNGIGLHQVSSASKLLGWNFGLSPVDQGTKAMLTLKKTPH